MKKFVKCLITVAVGAVIALLFAASRGVFGGLDQKTLYHILSDSFTVVGVVSTGVGLLLFVSNEGAFDGLSYGLRSFFGIFRKNYVKESYYDYKVRRGSHKMGFTTLLISGLVLLAVAIVFYLLYRQAV